MSFKIIGDSCTDPVPGLKDAPEYAMVPLIIRIGNQEYVDNGMLTTEDLVARMAASPEGTGTACPAPQWYMDAFEGADEVYVVTLSAELSGSYNSAVQARDIYLEEHPEKKIHVFNSHSASAGQSALLIKLFELCRAGLHIKLVMEGTPAGTIRKVSQALSVKQALARLADAAAEKAKKHGIEGRTLVISHCNCPDRAVYVRNLLFKKLPFTQVEMVRTGGISTVYAGDGGVVVAF